MKILIHLFIFFLFNFVSHSFCQNTKKESSYKKFLNFFSKDTNSNLNRTHYNCRSSDPNKLKHYHIQLNITRPYVPDEYVSWNKNYSYQPLFYTSVRILLGKELWIDPNDPKAISKWNQIDRQINRKSYMGKYSINSKGYPLNPIGRTGIIGRGNLGRWAVNHAADTIVTRWKLDSKNKTVTIDGKKVLQFVAIKRKDTGEWAIPGGMVEKNETVSKAAQREFMEEAHGNVMTKELKNLFKNGNEIYKGYVDDSRNTDNAWMETKVITFHDGKYTISHLKSGDDAVNVKWMDIDKNIDLFANHEDFIKLVAEKHRAYW